MLEIDRILYGLLFTLTLGFFFHWSEPGRGPGMNWLTLDFSRRWKKPAPPSVSWHTQSGGAGPRVAHSRHSKGRRQEFATVPTYVEPQKIAARYIDGRKLRGVLNREFGSEYRLQVSGCTSERVPRCPVLIFASPIDRCDQTYTGCMPQEDSRKTISNTVYKRFGDNKLKLQEAQEAQEATCKLW
jgi:hypothetical protein